MNVCKLLQPQVLNPGSFTSVIISIPLTKISSIPLTKNLEKWCMSVCSTYIFFFPEVRLFFSVCQEIKQ